MLKLLGSTSAKTGFAPTLLIDSAVAKKEKGVVMTSSPSPMPNALSPITKASVPEFTPIACLTSKYSATSCSNSLASGPIINAPDSSTRSIAS